MLHKLKTVVLCLLLACSCKGYSQTDTTVGPYINAEFPGGQTALFRFMIEKVTHGFIMSKEENPLAKVLLSFTVDELGTACCTKITKTSGNEAIDQLILEAVAMMPKWTPAQDRKGRNMKQEFKFPLYICGR